MPSEPRGSPSSPSRTSRRRNPRLELLIIIGEGGAELPKPPERLVPAQLPHLACSEDAQRFLRGPFPPGRRRCRGVFRVLRGGGRGLHAEKGRGARSRPQNHLPGHSRGLASEGVCSFTGPGSPPAPSAPLFAVIGAHGQTLQRAVGPRRKVCRLLPGAKPHAKLFLHLGLATGAHPQTAGGAEADERAALRRGGGSPRREVSGTHGGRAADPSSSPCLRYAVWLLLG